MASRPQDPQHADGSKPDERQSLLSFYQRYSYSSHGNQGPRRRNTDTNSLLNGQNISSKWQDAKVYLNADVSTRWTDIILIACFFISGLVDSGTYNAYQCFVSMQVSLSSHCPTYGKTNADSQNRQATQSSQPSASPTSPSPPPNTPGPNPSPPSSPSSSAP